MTIVKSTGTADSCVVWYIRKLNNNNGHWGLLYVPGARDISTPASVPKHQEISWNAAWCL